MAEAEQLNPNRTTAPITLDDLPIDLHIRILSLLPIFCAVRTSLVSRKWRNLWHFIPVLEFYLKSPIYEDPDNHLGMANRITQLILYRPKSNPVREFRLSFHYFPNHRHRNLVSSWLRYAVDCSVEEIELGFYTEHDEIYDFHFSDLRSRPVRCLILSDCEIVMPSSNCLNRFDSLRILSLTTVEITDESLSSLISMCENLEEFSLDLGICYDLRKFKIISKSLKVLRLIGYFGAVSENSKESSLEISTPNLSSIEISDFYVDSYSGDLSSVDEAKVLFSNRLNFSEKCWNNAMDLLRGVKILKIQAPSPTFMCSKFESDGFELQRLKHLELKTGHTLGNVFGLCAIFESCPALETLVLNIMPGLEDEDEEEEELDKEDVMRELIKSNTFRFHIPSLEALKIQGCTSTIFELLLVCLFKKSQTVSKKFDPVLVRAIPGPAFTRRRGFVHYNFG